MRTTKTQKVFRSIQLYVTPDTHKRLAKFVKLADIANDKCIFCGTSHNRMGHVKDALKAAKGPLASSVGEFTCA